MVAFSLANWTLTSLKSVLKKIAQSNWAWTVFLCKQFCSGSSFIATSKIVCTAYHCIIHIVLTASTDYKLMFISAWK